MVKKPASTTRTARVRNTPAMMPDKKPSMNGLLQGLYRATIRGVKLF